MKAPFAPLLLRLSGTLPIYPRIAHGKLADKSVIAQTLKQLTEQGLSDHVCLIFPVLRLNYGDPGSDKTP